MLSNLPTRLKQTIRALPFALLCLEAGCGTPAPLEFHSLLAEQPQVVEVSPSERSELLDPLEISLTFSERIDLDSLSPSAVSLVVGLPKDEILTDAIDMAKGLESGEIPQVSLQYFLEDNERSLTVVPEAPLQAGVYVLVVTPRLHSVRGIPFNQKPGESPAIFSARYTYGDIPSSSLDTAPQSGDIPSTPSFGPAPASLLISELLYDGKVSDTDGENFVELFGTPGADISLYQILFINGADGAETERITLPPGSQIAEDGIFLIADLRTSSTTASKVLNADFLDQFDPQNGPDGVQLLDRGGTLLDSLAYGNGAPNMAENGLALGEGNPAPDVAAGHSLSRVDGVDSGDNARDFVDLATPSPGTL